MGSLTCKANCSIGRGGTAPSFGPPAQVLGVAVRLTFVDVLLTGHVEMGTFVHDVEGEMFCESINPKIPYFNAPIYLENKVRTSFRSFRDVILRLMPA